MFVGLYMMSLFFFIYIPNKNKLFYYPKGKLKPVSVVMPCYNEAAHIGDAIKAMLNLDYPKNMLEIIIVDDKSTDNSVDIIKEYVKKYKNIKLIINKENSGRAAIPTNLGIKAAKYDYIAVADSDSTPQKDALKKMIGFLQEDEKTAAVTCSILAKESKTFIQKLQSIEYVIICFNRKLLDLIDAVYVTPGPFALYKKKILLEIGLFDPENLTQDIEIVWRLYSHGYKARMCLPAKVYSTTPNKFKKWWKQRVRWNIGGTQTLLKYKSLIMKKGMLGVFIIPFFSFSLFLGVFGLGIFSYLWSRRLLTSYLSTRYSFYADTSILRLEDLTFAPSILNFFGVILFILGLSFTYLGLGIMKEETLKHKNIFNIMFYILIYLAVYPTIMITSLYKVARRKYSW